MSFTQTYILMTPLGACNQTEKYKHNKKKNVHDHVSSQFIN